MLRRLREWANQLGSSGRIPQTPFSLGNSGLGAGAGAERGVDEAWYLSEQQRTAEAREEAPAPLSWEAREERGEVP